MWDLVLKAVMNPRVLLTIGVAAVVLFGYWKWNSTIDHLHKLEADNVILKDAVEGQQSLIEGLKDAVLESQRAQARNADSIALQIQELTKVRKNVADLRIAELSKVNPTEAAAKATDNFNLRLGCIEVLTSRHSGVKVDIPQGCL